MGKTWKDRPPGTRVKVVMEPDGSFEVFVNNVGTAAPIDERGLNDILCVRFGYCQQEFTDILKKLELEQEVVLVM